jgi:2,4-diaminopentanoate dehydrogenase
MLLSEPFTRRSTASEPSRMPIGRLLRRLIALEANTAATTKDKAPMYGAATSCMMAEKLVRVGGGKLTWPVADSIVDIANGHTREVLKSAAVARRDAIRIKLPHCREHR